MFLLSALYTPLPRGKGNLERLKKNPKPQVPLMWPSLSKSQGKISRSFSFYAAFEIEDTLVERRGPEQQGKWKS